GQTLEPFIEGGGWCVRSGLGFHGDFLGPRVSRWDPSPNLGGRFRALAGRVATGLTCSWFQASAKPVLLHQPKERKPTAELDGASMEEAASSCPQKSPLEETCQKLWKNLKMLPQTGKKVQQQLKSHLVAVHSSSLQDTRPAGVTHGSGAGAGDSAWKDNFYMDPFVATSFQSPSQPQASRNKDDPSRKALRSASWNEVTPRVRGWRRAIVRALSSQASKPEPRDLKEPRDDWLPEEYHTPPPFAPGYC
ncbi:hematopoietic SH2 domain-containing protein, partial [Camelus dromedarius]|uniref:hematopoietic SH2 domain-containing protein n=1 Tax=Camelus dromedarius TaxID=9838 RepID=UPI00311A6A6F